jgi:hypothetical protein
MNIVMLGHHGAGTTTFVSLMYCDMQDGVHGFALRATDHMQHRQLMADADRIRRGHYPAATHRRTSFDLVLHHQGAAILPFQWRDYRGGALTGLSTSPDVAALHHDLTIADGIVLLVDGVKLLRSPRSAADLRRLVVLVQRALRERDAVPTPLVVTVTKCDLLDLDDKTVVDAIFNPFEALVAAVAESEHVHGTILPVACGPQPTNVVLPVLWALHYGVVGHAMRLHALIESAQASATFATANDTLGDRVRSWWRNEPSWAALSVRHQQDALAHWRLLEPLIEPAEQLGTLLDDIPRF